MDRCLIDVEPDCFCVGEYYPRAMKLTAVKHVMIPGRVFSANRGDEIGSCGKGEAEICNAGQICPPLTHNDVCQIFTFYDWTYRACL